MIRLKISLAILLFLCSFILKAQEIVVEAKNEPLNDVLVNLRDRYHLSFSYDDDLLSGYKVTLHKSFGSIENCLNNLLKPYPLSFESQSKVYIIYPEKGKKIEKHPTKTYLLSGMVVDNQSKEGLPFTNIVVNKNGVSTDQTGRFVYKSKLDSVFRVQISHLGYFIIDTTINSGTKHLLQLQSSTTELGEVVVSGKVLETFIYTGIEPAVLSLNHQVTRFLPGSSDNSVFNLMRLQPGILATSEQSNDLMVWGSYPGESRIDFDGILLYGLQNFNDNISAVNPFMVKNLRIFKAGYHAGYGDCVGGIAEITGKDGGNKPTLLAGINNYTLNVYGDIPVGKRSSLMLALRHTYYNLYDEMESDLLKQKRDLRFSDATIVPDYTFRDFNVKFISDLGAGVHFQVNSILGQDLFDYAMEEKLNRNTIIRNANEDNLQFGISAKLLKIWENGSQSSFLWSDSRLKTSFANNTKRIGIQDQSIVENDGVEGINQTSEKRLSLNHRIPINDHHKIHMGLAYVSNKSVWYEDSVDGSGFRQTNTGDHITMMLRDEIAYKQINVNLGIRVNYLPYLNHFYHDPRLTLSYKLTEKFRLKLAYGIYHQFVMKSSIIDEYENYHYMWTVANNNTYPVLKSNHLVGGVSMKMKNYQVNVEPFLRTTEGVTQYVNHQQQGYQNVYNGSARSYGIDFYLKKDYERYTAWAAYTLSKVEETYEFYKEGGFKHAPHDQRHELKLALMMDFDPVVFSVNHVYGSGFMVPHISNGQLSFSKESYNRMDMACTYKIQLGKLLGEAGVSILNVFNTNNRLYNNLERIPLNQSSTIEIYSESVPFTPSLFLKIQL